ncbi:hypothetical protein LTR09_005071 [Extremus antarcticus]|uniref:AB hydrolase-1 domain-containing protein n=1 Tax=Extremus antarcticus TaxID=702011 RepID=A0AAJ0DNE2_9PEZI|nr:hypothetical protein LTR09_005071 [Extremus antarcticus]
MLARRALPRLHQPPTPSLRLYSTTALSNGITLAYDLHPPPKPASANAPPILFLHGLFGSKKNNRSMIYALDLRNHGASSHDRVHTYDTLAEDVELFLQHHDLRRPTLIGHSMGAKTVMTLALRKRVSVANIIPVDNAPVDAALGSSFAKYVQGMRKISETTISRQSQADEILKDYEDDLTIRQFLLGNLVRQPHGTHAWQIPIKILSQALDHMAAFPFTDPEEARYEGPTLVLWWSGWGIRNDEGYDGSLEEAHDGPARQQDVKRPTSGHCTPKVKRSQASGRWMDIVPLRERIYSLQLQAIAVDVQRPQHLFWTPQARLNSCSRDEFSLTVSPQAFYVGQSTASMPAAELVNA